jgi:hypothetical protein
MSGVYELVILPGNDYGVLRPADSLYLQPEKIQRSKNRFDRIARTAVNQLIRSSLNRSTTGLIGLVEESSFLGFSFRLGHDHYIVRSTNETSERKRKGATRPEIGVNEAVAKQRQAISHPVLSPVRPPTTNDDKPSSEAPSKSAMSRCHFGSLFVWNLGGFCVDCLDDR